MGKSLKGKELGVGISQRKDGTYQARFTNRFGKRETIYDKKLSEIRRKLRESQYEDDKKLNTVSVDMTLNEWFEVWINTCKKNCRDTTINSYKAKYNYLKAELGWRQLSSLNLIDIQEIFNNLKNDCQRKYCKTLFVDILDKAVNADLITKNIARQLNTVVTKETKKERRVLTKTETRIFLEAAEGTVYYNLYILALETGLRIGEIMGLKWEDVDFNKQKLEVKRTLCYVKKDKKYIHEFHDTKTINGQRTVPLTAHAIYALKKQKIQKNEILLKGKNTSIGFENLVFVTKNNQPTELMIIQDSIDYIIKRLQKERTFERFSSHTFRHTFATRAIERGMNPKTLQKILGHSSLQMTMDLYCHVTDDTLFDEMKKFEMYD